MNKVLVRIGTGVPVDLEAFLALGTTSVSWRPDREYHGDLSDLAINEFIRALALDKEGSDAYTVMLQADANVRFGAVFSPTDQRGHASFEFIDQIDDPTELDALAALGDETTFSSDGNRTRDQRNRAAQKLAIANNQLLFCLPAVAETHWFGEHMVSWFGGDEVFESMPSGWTERTDYGQWRVNGRSPTDDPDRVDTETWSERERAIVQHIGRDYFFDAENGVVPATPQPPPVGLAPFESYLWRDDQLMIRTNDSLRPAT